LFKITVIDSGSKVDTFATPTVSTGLSYTESSYRSTVFGMRQGYNMGSHTANTTGGLQQQLVFNSALRGIMFTSGIKPITPANEKFKQINSNSIRISIQEK